MPSDELHEWFVTTPEYETVEDRIDGHTLYSRGSDWEQVQAHTKREAVTIAVRGWLNQWEVCPQCHGVGDVPDANFYCGKCHGGGNVLNPRKQDNYCLGRKLDGLCPWTGVRAEIAACGHGHEMPLDFEDDFWCDECRESFDREYADD